VQVSSEEGKRVADEMKAAEYCECSAKTSRGVREMFETAVRLALYDSKGKLKIKSSHNSSHKSGVFQRIRGLLR